MKHLKLFRFVGVVLVGLSFFMFTGCEVEPKDDDLAVAVKAAQTAINALPNQVLTLPSEQALIKINEAQDLIDAVLVLSSTHDISAWNIILDTQLQKFDPLTLAVKAAQAAINALPRQVQTLPLAEALVKVNEAQALVNAVVALDETFDISAWNIVLEKYQEADELELAISAAQLAINALPSLVKTLPSAEALAKIDEAQDLVNTVVALDQAFDISAWEIILESQYTKVEAWVEALLVAVEMREFVPEEIEFGWIKFPATHETYGAIVWESDNENAIKTDGYVVFTEDDVTVTLKGSLTINYLPVFFELEVLVVGDDFDYHDLSVRDFVAEHGMVAAATSYASKVGVDILRSGGNAFDAIVGVAFALGVTEPNAYGLGGGSFMVGYDALEEETFAYNFREWAPLGTNVSQYLVGATNRLYKASGVGAVGVPQNLDGLLTILENHGTLTLEDVIMPSVFLARYGFKIYPELSAQIGTVNLNSKLSGLASIYTSNGLTPLQAGDLLINEPMAKLYEKVISEGRDGFYAGEVANDIISIIQAGNGQLALADMEYAKGNTKVVSPLSATYKEYEIISMTPPSGGAIALGGFFNMLEIYDAATPISALSQNSAQYLHVIGTAFQLAFGDRASFMVDDNFYEVPIHGLLSKEYAAVRWDNFNPAGGGRLSTAILTGGNPWVFEPGYVEPEPQQMSEIVESYSTTHFSVVDELGNVVAITGSINSFWGSGVAVPKWGILLNNHMDDFDTTVGSKQVMEPLKVPTSSMSPTIVMKDGSPFMTLGSPGALRILTAIGQVILNVIEFDMDIQSAIEAPRIHQQHNANITFENIGVILDQEVVAGLQALGYTLGTRYTSLNNYFGGVQGIVIDPVTGQIHGGADPRRGGKALGY